MGKIVMNEEQVSSRNKFLKKIGKGEYKLVENKCLCGGERDLIIADKDRYDIPITTVMCMECGLVRSNPYYDEKTLKSFYKNEYRQIYSGSKKAKDVFFEEQVMIGKKIIKYIEKSTKELVDEKIVFEVGCGAGGILKAFKNRRCQVFGCDFGNEYLQKGKKEGIELVEGDSSVLRSFGKADIVVLNHVLEHFLNPVTELKKISSLLKPSGILYVAVPGLLHHRKSYGSLRWYLQNAHVYSFYLSSLEYVLNKAGFRKISGSEKIKSIFVEDKSVRIKERSVLQKVLIYLFLKLSYKL